MKKDNDKKHTRETQKQETVGYSAHERVRESQRDAYIFEIQHMDHSNPYWVGTAVASTVALLALAYEIFSMYNNGGVMTWIFALVLLSALIVLWYLQRKYKEWELSKSEDNNV